MWLCGSYRAGDLSPYVAADLLGVVVADPGLQSGHQPGALGCALSKGLETLVLLEEVRALLEDAALHGGGALPKHWLALCPQGQGP